MITHWFYPDQVPRAFRSYELYKNLMEKGYDIDIVAVKDKKIYYSDKGIDDIILTQKNTHNTKKNLGTSLKSNIKKYKFFKWGLKSILFFVGEIPFVTRKKFLKQTFSKINFNKYDNVIVISLPFYTAYYTVKHLNKILWKGRKILDLGDPFYGHQVKRAFYFEEMQKKVLDSFDYITVPIQESLPYYEPYVPIEKLRIIPQAFDFSNIRKEDYAQNTPIRFAYAGTFYEDIRNPINMLDFLRNLEEEFLFEIYTNKNTNIYFNILKDFEKNMNGKLIIHDSVKRDQLIYELSKMDFLINLENLSGIQTPSKLIDYALAGRPIVSVNPSEKRPKSLIEFLSRNYSSKINIDLENYNIDNVSKKFIELFEGRDTNE